jgi:hypothetical protein
MPPVARALLLAIIVSAILWALAGLLLWWLL